MKAPSFRCSENPDGSIILHYYSDRPGLEFIVIGLVKTVAKKLHNSDVEVNVIKSKGLLKLSPEILRINSYAQPIHQKEK